MSITAREAAQVITQMQRRSVLVVGDVMLDRYVDGAAQRLSPEAPVPVLGMTGETCLAGGAANVACNLAALGCHVRLIGVTGEDENGRALARQLKSSGAVTFKRVVDKSRPTTTKTRYRANGQQMLRVDNEARHDVDAKTAAEIVKHFGAVGAKYDYAIISDYAKGALPASLVAELIHLAKCADMPLVVDPKHDDFKRYAGANILTPNLAELRRATAIASDDVKDIAKAASRLAGRLGATGILTTLGPRGVLFAGPGRQPHHVASIGREVFDVSGAGDTVVACLTAALCGATPLRQACALANLAAGVVVGKLGTAVATPGEIICMAGAPAPDTDIQRISRLCREWAAGGLTIGFANGCFDMLHPGHIHLLRHARAHCNRLVVGINSDASVRRLKGETRPMQSQDSRAAALMQIEHVDEVAVFDEDTPLDLIKAIQPNFIFKGGDYKKSEVVGGEVAKANGGEVVIIPTFVNHSSSAIEDNMRTAAGAGRR